MNGDAVPGDRLVLQLGEFTLGRPYHAALCQVSSRSTHVRFHTHQDFYELFYVVAGGGEHRLSSGHQPLRPGDLVLVRPSDWHSLVGLPPAGLEWINVAVPVATWLGMLDVANVVPVNELTQGSQPVVVSTSGDDAARLEASFRRALARYTLNAHRLDLIRFILDVLDVLAAGAEDEDSSTRPEWLVRACVAMNREENLRGGVRRLGELAGVSAGHLCRTMREYYGMTPTEFVTGLRIRHAEMLLTATSAPLTVIAYRCGFASPSYFSRCFHATQGMSPRDFRRHARLAVLP